MKKRQIKKNSKTAKQLLMLLAPSLYPEKAFTKNTDSEWEDTPKGTWEIWYRTSYEYDEWDANSAFVCLKNYIFGQLVEEEFDSGKQELICLYSPDLSTAKKVFDLAKRLIRQVVA